MSQVSVMLGIPVDASPWAVFGEIHARGYVVVIDAAPGGGLRATATGKPVVPTEREERVMHAVAADSLEELALELATAVVAWES